MRIIQECNLVFWIAYWLMLLWTCGSITWAAFRHAKTVNSTVWWSCVSVGSSATLFGLFYLYTIASHQLLGGHSVYFHLWYALLGEALAIIGVVNAIRVNSAYRQLLIAISTVMILAFGDQLGLIPHPEAPVYFVVFLALIAAQLFGAPRRIRNSSN